MKASVIINNYNYGHYLIECVNSVLAQTYTNIELIIVDDGSTDNSVKLLSEHYSNNEKIIIINKVNGGQLSTFNAAITKITGDIIFFLDADDLYKDNYIEKMIDLYLDMPDIDFIFCSIERFSSTGSHEIISSYPTSTHIGFSIISTLYTQEWLGSPTSGISMRVELGRKLLPIPLEHDWRTRADNCLVWGTSILGANKYYYNNPLVLYRTHAKNHYYQQKINNIKFYQYKIAILRLLNHLQNIAGLTNTVLNLTTLEFRNRKDKRIKTLWLYINILQLEKSLITRVRRTIRLLEIYFKELIKCNQR